MRDPILSEILSRRGATKRIAEACGVTHAAVSQWRMVPPRHVNTVAEIAGVPPEVLRAAPDQAAA